MSGYEENSSTSTGGDRAEPSKADPGFTTSILAFVALLLLAISWPSPVLWLNERTFRARLSIDHHSFLGREAPAWDVVFWAIAGLYALALIHGRLDQVAEGFLLFRRQVLSFPHQFRIRWRRLGPWRAISFVVAWIVIVATVWVFLDGPLIAAAESMQSDSTRLVTRFVNRLGGGSNPALIIIFFFLAGLAFRHERWSLLAAEMTAAALTSGAVVNLLKLLVGRSRPELWLGPFHYSSTSASSFPSGHTVGAFAIASVVLFGSRSLPLRVLSLALASAVGVSRVLGFRHWPSDVLASAILGIAFGWLFVTPLQMTDSAGASLEGQASEPVSSERKEPASEVVR